VNQRPLQRAVYLPPFGPFGNPQVLVELAVRAEAAGWDGVFLWDHVVSGAAPIADCWTSLGAMAAETRRIRIGSTVTPLPRRRPWIVARQAATVSRLSGGRTIVGVGLGTDESGDFSRFGEETDLRARASMLAEAVDIMRSMWAGTPHTHAGDHYTVDIPAAAAEPYPIPLWMASSTRNPPRRRARCSL
jgi:alkanesulfonate monooxygenase SsuD/methylene tetrahydromethanopterin reductase-like flavin-dependent oxidoreductase (luciferase family)